MVDGRPAEIGEQVDPEAARIAVDGVPLPVRPGLETWLLYKPTGVISTAADPEGRPTVVDLVPTQARIYPVGRLDADSEGLLLLTNDGELANLVTHPRHGITKTYVALVEGVPSREALRSLVEGIELEDGMARARSARLVDARRDRSLVEVVMTEGRKREVRRMLGAVGHEVQRLVRTAIGPIVDRDLSAGRSRRLAAAEIRALYSAAEQTWEDAGSPEDEV